MNLAETFKKAPDASNLFRFISKIRATDDDSCWEWTAAKVSGYGVFGVSPEWRMERAHRIALAWSGREVPEGSVVDHRCFNRGCVNPAHLDVVWQWVNLQRAAEHRNDAGQFARRIPEERSEPGNYRLAVDGQRCLREDIVNLVAEFPRGITFEQLHSHFRLTAAWYVKGRLDELERQGAITFDGQTIRSSSAA